MLIAPRSYGSAAVSADNEHQAACHRWHREIPMRFRPRSEKTHRLLTAGLAGLLYGGAAFADDVSGSDMLLCYGLSAARCETGALCEAVEPWRLNIPDFVKLDLRGKRIQTTAGSSEQRQTPLQTVQRSNGTILLQGVQGERAFTWLITETSGEGTLAVAGQGQGVTVFTVCTPVDKL
jgi:hypothetical protein